MAPFTRQIKRVLNKNILKTCARKGKVGRDWHNSYPPFPNKPNGGLTVLLLGTGSARPPQCSLNSLCLHRIVGFQRA